MVTTGRPGCQHHDLISHSFPLFWHWANQSLPYANNTESMARKWQLSNFKLLVWLDQSSNPWIRIPWSSQMGDRRSTHLAIPSGGQLCDHTPNKLSKWGLYHRMSRSAEVGETSGGAVSDYWGLTDPAHMAWSHCNNINRSQHIAGMNQMWFISKACICG